MAERHQARLENLWCVLYTTRALQPNPQLARNCSLLRLIGFFMDPRLIIWTFSEPL